MYKEGLKGDSVCEGLATQAWRPNLVPSADLKKTGMVVYARNLSPVTDPVSKARLMASLEEWHPKLSSGLYTTCTHLSPSGTGTCAHTHEYMKQKENEMLFTKEPHCSCGYYISKPFIWTLKKNYEHAPRSHTNSLNEASCSGTACVKPPCVGHSREDQVIRNYSRISQGMNDKPSYPAGASPLLVTLSIPWQASVSNRKENDFGILTFLHLFGMECFFSQGVPPLKHQLISCVFNKLSSLIYFKFYILEIFKYTQN